MHVTAGVAVFLVVLALVPGHAFVTAFDANGSNHSVAATRGAGVIVSAELSGEQPGCPADAPPGRIGHYLIAWGANEFGQLGDGSTTNLDRASFVPVTFPAEAVSDVAVGGGHSLALLNDGTVWAWGANGSGQLGLRDTLDRPEPIQVPGILGRVLQIAAGDAFSLARVDDGPCGLGEQTTRVSSEAGTPPVGHLHCRCSARTVSRWTAFTISLPAGRTGWP